MPPVIHPEDNLDDSWHAGGAWSPEWAARKRHNQFGPKPEEAPYEFREYPKVVEHKGHHVTVHTKEAEDNLVNLSEDELKQVQDSHRLGAVPLEKPRPGMPDAIPVDDNGQPDPYHKGYYEGRELTDSDENFLILPAASAPNEEAVFGEQPAGPNPAEQKEESGVDEAHYLPQQNAGSEEAALDAPDLGKAPVKSKKAKRVEEALAPKSLPEQDQPAVPGVAESHEEGEVHE